MQIHRSGAWPGWAWLDRVLGLDWYGEAGIVALALMLLPVPSIVVRRMSYRIRRRKDWEVLVFSGCQPDYRPRKAVRVENCPDRAAAELRAELIASRLLGRDALPL